jgi:AcrR family transcriptional regulator
LGRPPGVDGSDTSKLILDEAERQFADMGYAMTTNKTVADACGLTTAALYHYFGTKPALYAAVSAQVHPSMLAAFEQTLTDTPPSFRARMKAILDASVQLHHQRPSLAGFVMGGPVEARRHPELRPIVDHHFSRIESLVDTLVADARARGELLVDSATEDVVGMVMSVLHGFAHLAYRDDSVDRFERVVRSFERLLDGVLLRQEPASYIRADR